MAILNNALYSALTESFGDVTVACEGEPCAGRYCYDDASRVVFDMQVGGEYYRVNCPFCNDTRKRLWVHHRWGAGTLERPDDKFWWAAICYNENCLSIPANRHALSSRVLRSVGRELHARDTVECPTQFVRPTGDVEDPGVCVPLTQLPMDHPANMYVLSRGFTAEYLVNNYGVSYCTQAKPEYSPATGRLIFPIFAGGIKVGWQGRYVGDLNWKNTGIAKYYTMPHFHKRQYLYGMDAAKALPFVVITEGVTDVCAIGAGAVALLGKSMSAAQAVIVATHWNKIVILLDEDAYIESEALYSRLRNTADVIRVQLPPGADPAQMAHLDPEYLWDLIYGTAVHAGVALT